MRQRTTILATLLLLTLVFSACDSAVTTLPTTSVAEATPPTSAETTTSNASPSSTARPTVTTSPTAEAEPSSTATQESPTVETTATSELTESPSATATEADSEPQVLEAKFYQDSDSNLVPDFLETELGYDPNADDCAQQQCGDAAQGTEFLFKERNTLLVLDSSGSMAAQAQGSSTNKLDTAKQALRSYVGVATTVSKVGFLVYGHKGNNTEAGKPESCVGIDLLTPIGQVQADTFSSVLDQFQPTGWTPIAAALTEAGEAFAGKEDAINRIILVSDGIETCEGDPVAVAEKLNKEGLKIQFSVIGFDIADGSADQAQLRKIAEVTGGDYYDAKTAQDLENYFRQQGQALAQTFDAYVCEAKNSTGATVCDLALVGQATSRLEQLSRESGVDEQQKEAIRALITEIQTSRDDRQQVRDEASKRADELSEQYSKLLEQLNKSLSDQNSP